MTLSNVSGFPRIGPRRELKFATEGFWAGKVSREDLEQTGRKIRADNWAFMRDSGIDLIPSNDFSFYDHVLDTISMVGAVPPRYRHEGGPVDLDTYFAMARGKQSEGVDVTAMEMTKWFDTNYHYLVPEWHPEVSLYLSTEKPFAEYQEAKNLGFQTVPVLVGPVSLLLLGKPGEGVDDDFDVLSLLDPLLKVYEEVITRLGELGAEWVQLDEPSFVEDRTQAELDALNIAYRRLARVAGRPKILVKTYFDHVGQAYPILANLPIEGIGLDFVRGPKNEELLETQGGLNRQTIFAGVVDGRNIWINDLEPTLALLDRLERYCEEVVVSTSCSLLHLPIDLDAEPDLDDEIRSWIAFANQTVREVKTIATGFEQGREAIADVLTANRKALDRRLSSPRTRNDAVRARVDSLSDRDSKRAAEFPQRREAQRTILDLPLFPTTTIGSFPQTSTIRQARARLRTAELTPDEYKEAMKREIEHVIRFQEEAGLDVLVHGEPERNDMVQYFAEQLDGYAFTKNAWVQSYGTRYVQPPILYGDIQRPAPMTLDWIGYAQSLTDRPVKGMLTGPVTMLMWSFVRDDQPRSETCMQLALAIRDEVADLEAAGTRVIQVDEPALREGLPLRKESWGEYLEWAVKSFKVATSSVADETQIHTHLCYSEFGDILEAIDALDADVNLMWSARAGMRLLDELQAFGYSNEVGPGVYDIHSPRVPSVDEMAEEIRLATKRLDPDKIWINPDCGLKTRGWEETEPSLRNMVAAARAVRQEISGS